MKHATHDDVVKRLKRADGHLRKVIAMIEDGRPCLDVVQQLHAVWKAVEQAKRIYVHDHIDRCLDGAAPGDGGETRAPVPRFREITRYL